MKPKIILYKFLQHHVPVGFDPDPNVNMAQFDKLRQDRGWIGASSHGNVVLKTKIILRVL